MDFTVFMNVSLLIAILAIAFVLVRIWRTGERPESLGEWAIQVQAAEQWARLAVDAAEQLYNSDQIEAGERFHHADKFLIETLPNLDASQRQMLIEAAVHSMTYVRRLRLGEREL